MKYFVVDFETFYDTAKGLTLKELSTPEYIGHPDFKVHNLGVRHPDGTKQVFWGDEAIQRFLDSLATEGDYCFIMHNAYFDAAIFKWKFNFTPERMLDTLLIANHVLGSAKDSGKGKGLADLAELLGLPAKGRLDFMDGVREPDKEQKTLLTSYLNTDLDLTWGVFTTLLPHVSRPEVELWLIDHTLRIYADRPLLLDIPTVERAERLIEERVTASIKRLRESGALALILPKIIKKGRGKKALTITIPPPETDAEVFAMLSSNKTFQELLVLVLEKNEIQLPYKTRPLTDNEKAKFEKLKAKALESGWVRGSDELTKFYDWLEKRQNEGVEVSGSGQTIIIGDSKQVPALSKKDEDFIRLSFSVNEQVSATVMARLIVRSSITSKSRLETMRRVASGLKVLPIHLVYYGAHTGRWAGGGGFNWQNLTNPDRATDPGQREIATAIREAIIIGGDESFSAADAAQIEARVSAWVTGEWDILKQFREGVDVYSAFISEVLAEDIHKPTGKEEPAQAAHLKLMRHIGKEAVLGLSYQMWVTKFVARLREDPNVAKMFELGKLTEGFIKEVVEAYRNKYTKIVAAWESLNNAFHMARRGAKVKFGPITFRSGTGIGSKLPVVEVVLPSGRKLFYRDIRTELRKDGKPGLEWKHGAGQRIYGGLLLENITQAIARDVLIETMIRAETEAGLSVLMNIHDSVVVKGPTIQAEANMKWLEESLRQVPEWADGRLVLNAEGKHGKSLVT